MQGGPSFPGGPRLFEPGRGNKHPLKGVDTPMITLMERKLNLLFGVARDRAESGGFFPLPEDDPPCKHPSHNPPSHIHVPEGKGYRHVCPHCGEVQILMPSRVTL